jgi:DNA-binding XRE family transcriptional regulator
VAANQSDWAFAVAGRASSAAAANSSLLLISISPLLEVFLRKKSKTLNELTAYFMVTGGQ